MAQDFADFHNHAVSVGTHAASLADAIIRATCEANNEGPRADSANVAAYGAALVALVGKFVEATYVVGLSSSGHFCRAINAEVEAAAERGKATHANRNAPVKPKHDIPG